MLVKKCLLFFLVVLVAGLGMVAKEVKVEVKQAAEKISERVQGKSLIRKDLLFEEREKLGPPTRNIFSAFSGRSPQTESLPEEAGISPKSPLLSRVDSDGHSEEDKPYLKYIGFVKSGQKIIALVILEGEALAVIENEMIGEEIRVGKVTSEEIELIGANSQKWIYSLEGEEE